MNRVIYIFTISVLFFSYSKAYSKEIQDRESNSYSTEIYSNRGNTSVDDRFFVGSTGTSTSLYPDIEGTAFVEENDWDNGLGVGEVVPVENSWFVFFLSISIYMVYIIGRAKKKRHW